MIGRGQHGAIPHEPGCPKAIWGQFRRKKFRASEDLFTQNPDPAERNTRPDFYVSCAGDGPISGALGAGWPYWLPFGWAGKAGGREWVNSRKERTQFWEGCCASASCVRFQALTVPCQWQPVLFPLPGFTGNLPTPKCRLLVKAFFFGGGEWALIVFRTHFYRPVMSTMLENGICGMCFKKMSCWYWTLSVFVKLLFCINTVFDKHLY